MFDLDIPEFYGHPDYLLPGWLPPLDRGWDRYKVSSRAVYQILQAQFPGCLEPRRVNPESSRVNHLVFNEALLREIKQIPRITDDRINDAMRLLDLNRRNFGTLRIMLNVLYDVIEHRYAQQQSTE